MSRASTSAAAAAFSRCTPVLTIPCPNTRGASPLPPLTMTALVRAVPMSIPAVCCMFRSPQAKFETLVQLFQGKQGGADGAGEVRLRADLQLAAEHFFQCAHHAGVAGHAAGHGDLRVKRDAPGQGNSALGNGLVHASQNVLP